MNPPTPPAYSMSSPTDMLHGEPVGPPKWSALAVSAFVLSIIGFLGFTAILGIILGVAGIFVTRNGRRRGMGLAIAALPISLATGAVGAFLVILVAILMRVADVAEQIEPILEASTDVQQVRYGEILDLGSPGFQSKVTGERLKSWLGEVDRKHGKLTELEVDKTSADWISANADGDWVLSMRGKFVNGPALVRMTFAKESMLKPRIEDLEIDGLSPRAEGTTPEKTAE